MSKKRMERKEGMPRVKVRRFRNDDSEQASQVMIAAFKSFLPRQGRARILRNFSPELLCKAGAQDTKDATAACFIAMADHRIVGYIRGSVTPYGVGSLGVIGVSPDRFHQGVGSQLLRKMVAFWRKRGMRKVSTCVSAHNGRALCFYLRHGFRPVGYQRDHFLPGMDEVILDRFLT